MSSYTGTCISDLVETVERVERQIKLGTCEFEYSESAYGRGDAVPCGRESVSWCDSCGREMCGSHLYICCVQRYCTDCLAEHECAIVAFGGRVSGRASSYAEIIRRVGR